MMMMVVVVMVLMMMMVVLVEIVVVVVGIYYSEMTLQYIPLRDAKQDPDLLSLPKQQPGHRLRAGLRDSGPWTSAYKVSERLEKEKIHNNQFQTSSSWNGDPAKPSSSLHSASFWLPIQVFG